MKVLLLAGTAEAHILANYMKENNIEAIASLAGETRNAKAFPIPTRIGGFGGKDALANYIKVHKINTIIDATHPFAQQMTKHASEVDVEHHAILSRKKWEPRPQDQWIEINTYHEINDYITQPANVFIATGRKTLECYTGLDGCTLFMRVIDTPNIPFPHEGAFVVSRPPFKVSDEISLFTKLKIDWLIVKNAGGAASFSKLEAASKLNIPVLMLKRPALPKTNIFKTTDKAISWLKHLT